ncbi:MAG: nucleoside triphosphate pyrophosphohydrolase [Symbiobacteriaceae bacterium]|nr:nucleoside triphosphate pyrophosphohydrolase [Symbiobacteriaceae bacterium]
MEAILPKRIIHLIGLGSGSPGELTLETQRLLESGIPLFLRTRIHPTVTWLEEKGILYTSFDDLYETSEDFNLLYSRVFHHLLAEMDERSEILYGVPGHPLLAERVGELLLKGQSAESYTVKVYPAVSAVESISAALGIDPATGLIIQDALNYRSVAGELPQLILQLYNRRVASDLKLTLMSEYSDDAEVIVIRAAGVSGEERQQRVPLRELDHLDWIDHLTSLYIPGGNRLIPSSYPLDKLVGIMARLRDDDGCPWDREQDHRSLRQYCLEEACEVIVAIEQGETGPLVDELGDLLLQVVFHACIGAEDREFDLNDISAAICSKLIRRHPHVFGDLVLHDAEEVVINWERIKGEENRSEGEVAPALLKGVGSGLPALTRARKLLQKAASIGFDWDDREEVVSKVKEEWQELLESMVEEHAHSAEEEFGDLFLSLVNLARWMQIDPELALTLSCEKFIRRFSQIEKESRTLGKNLICMTSPEKDALWNLIKGRMKD